MLRPRTVEEAGEAVHDVAAAGRSVRPRGGGTKLDWGGRGPEDAVELDTRGLGRILEHNVGDFTAVLEAGVSVAAAQERFASAGQMLSLDPWLGAEPAATIGGLIATADSGPLRHRYGSVRDLVLGMTVVLSDGAISSSGGKVIKNVAGYDIAKLFAGSYGTLGLIASVSVRLHPLPPARATARVASSDPDAIAAKAIELAKLPLEAESMDVAWAGGRGELLVRFAGSAAVDQATETAGRLRALGDAGVLDDDDALWARQRGRQRALDGGVAVKVSGRPTDLPRVLRAAEAHGGTVASRAAHGLSWVVLPSPGDLAAFRQALAPRACTVLDGAGLVADPWPPADPGVLALMRRIKSRFDPARAFRPGAYLGGI